MTRKGLIPGLALALALSGAMSEAKEVCLSPPYEGGPEELMSLKQALADTLAPHPLLAKALTDQAPDLCLDDTLFAEQGYYEPATNRIVLRAGLERDFQLAILVHEIRHLQQFGLEICPTTSATLTDYMRSRLAMEADAAAIGVYVAWTLKQGGQPGPWDTLALWPSHQDLVARFASEMEAGADVVAATSATHAQWYLKDERREIYAFAICSNYLDALDEKKLPPGHGTLPEDFADRLCRMPDGQPYGCVIPP